MKLTDERSAGVNTVRSYSPGQIKIGESVVTRSCLINASTLISDWRPQALSELSLEDLEPIFGLAPDIVVLGSGLKQRFPPMEWMAALMSRGIGCDVMDTGAACRTYNVLVSEGRKVVAALFVN